VFLILANPGPGAGAEDLTERVTLLLGRLQSDRDVDTAIGDGRRQLLLASRALHADKHFEAVGPADVLAFIPLMLALGAEGAAGDLDPELGCRILWAYALALPYYGAGKPTLLLPAAGSGDAGRRLDRVILFCQLDDAAKRTLESWAGDERLSAAARAHLRQLLIDHNNLGLLLAEEVFRDRDLLRLTRRETPYAAETFDFNVLYHYRKDLNLNARALLDDAVRGCEQNFRLIRQHARGERSDEVVLEFLFTGKWAPDAEVPAALDNVLRRAVKVRHDPRYEQEKDEEVRSAARAFQKAVQGFVANPPAVAWFTADGPGLQRAATYLRVAEQAGARIGDGAWGAWDLPRKLPDRALQGERWQRAARADYAGLWRRLLFGTNPPPWQSHFVHAFCRGSVAEQRRRLATLVAGEEEGEAPAPGLRLRGLRWTLQQRDRLRHSADREAAEYQRAYWQAARAVLGAAQVGAGLKEKTPFLAQSFLAGPGGAVRALTEAEVAGALAAKTDKSGLFEALDWPRRWDARFPEPELQGLLGPVLPVALPDRPAPGLGGTVAEPTTYRLAAWLALSHFARAQLDRPLAALDGMSKALRSAPAAARLGQGRQRQQGVAEAVADVLAFRRLHNERMAALQVRSERAALPAGGVRRSRGGAWAWYRVDTTTLRWARERHRGESWSYLAPLWAPFAVYAGVGAEEGEALGLTPAAWQEEDEDLRLHALLHLLSLVEVPRAGGEGVRLAPATAQAFAALRRRPDLGRGRPDPAGCAARVETWTDLSAWEGLARPERQQVLVALGRYRYRAVPDAAVAGLRAGKLGPLAATLCDLCHWRGEPSPRWCKKYARKMAFVRTCAAAGPLALPKEDGRKWLPALAALYEVACRAEPCAGPYLADFAAGRVRLVRAPRRLWPQTIRALAAREQRRLWKEMGPWCVVQREVGPGGQLVILKAGFLGYLDMLGKTGKGDARGR
jgi:hypothetical protein